MDFEMQDEGYLAKTFYPEGTKDIPLGEVLAVLAENEEDVAAFKDMKVESGAAPVQAEAAKVEEAPTQAAPTQAAPSKAAAPQQSSAPASGSRKFVSPLAQNIAAEAGLNLVGVSGTGPNGRIIKADVEDALTSGGSARPVETPVFDSVSAGDFVDIPNSQIRKVIADRLTFSKQNIPHYYVTTQVAVDNLLALRSKLNKVSSSKISVNDFVMKATALASLKVPMTNSSWNGDYIRQYNNVNMCFAVQTDNGLMAPCLNNINLKGLEEIAIEVKDIAGRARENKLKPEELSGGTFTVSNLGMYGANNFSAIINPPQACILAVGGAVKTVVVNEKAGEGEDPYRVAHLMNVTLSSDHRVVDGAVAAEWGLEFKRLIENPEQMLL